MRQGGASSPASVISFDNLSEAFDINFPLPGHTPIRVKVERHDWRAISSDEPVV